MGVVSQVDKRMEIEERKKAKFTRKYELLNEGFFLNRTPLDIANEIEKMIEDIQDAQKDSSDGEYAIIDYICQYRSTKGIDNNVVDYGVNNKVRALMETGILAKKNLKERLKYIATDIADERERITIELFFANRMTKIIDKIREYCFKKENKYKKILQNFMKDNKDFDGKIILTSEDIDTINQWRDNNGINKKEKNNFIAFIKLKLMVNYFYNIKNDDLIKLAEMAPEVMYWDDSNNCVAIMLENYAFPIAFHFIYKPNNPNMFDPSKYNGINIDRNLEKYIHCFPIRLNASERKEFDRAIRAKYPESIPVPSTMAGKQDTEDSKIEDLNNQTEKENNDGTIINTDDKIKGEVVENMEEIKENINENVEEIKEDTIENRENAKTKEPQKFTDGNSAKRRNLKYRPNEEIAKMVADELKNAGVITDMSEECMEKLAYVSPKQVVKLEKVYNDIREIVVKLKVDEDKVNIETAKLFAYMKILDRGFWVRSNIKGSTFEDYVKRAMDEMTPHNSREFFDGVSAGMELDEHRRYMNEKTGRTSEKTITGAKTLQKNQEKEIIETDGVKNEEIVNNDAIKEETQNNGEREEEIKKDDEKKEESKSVEGYYTEEDKAEMEKLKSKSSEDLTTSLKEIIHNLQKEHKELENLKKELEQKNEALKSKITSLSVDYERHVKSLKDIEDVFNDPENVAFLKQIGQFEKLQNKYSLIKKKIDEYEEIQSKLTEGNEKVEQISRKQTQIEEEVKNKIEEEFRDL